MEIQENRYLKIRFINGTEQSYAFEPLDATTDAAILYTRVHKMLDSRRLVLQTHEKTIVIPFDNIESFEIAPTTDRQIPDAIRVVHDFNI